MFTTVAGMTDWSHPPSSGEHPVLVSLTETPPTTTILHHHPPHTKHTFHFNTNSLGQRNHCKKQKVKQTLTTMILLCIFHNFHIFYTFMAFLRVSEKTWQFKFTHFHEIGILLVIMSVSRNKGHISSLKLKAQIFVKTFQISIQLVSDFWWSIHILQWMISTFWIWKFIDRNIHAFLIFRTKKKRKD